MVYEPASVRAPSKVAMQADKKIKELPSRVVLIGRVASKVAALFFIYPFWIPTISQRM